MTYNPALWIFGLITVYILIWILYSPIKAFLKIVLNSAIGTAALVVINFIFGFAGFSVGINIWTAASVGLLGVPGLFLVILLKVLL